jgi:hypothetical protein
MLWQDIVLSIGSIVFIFALIPTVFSKDKPPLASSIPTGIVLFVFAMVYFSLHLLSTGITNLITSTLWFIIAFQKYFTDHPSN